MNMGEMIFSNIRWKITLLIVICFCSLETKAKYGGGSGEPNDPYLIYTAEHMQAIGADSNDWGLHFKLIADIDLSHYDGNDGRPTFNMIGFWDQYSPKPFRGIFDGNGHTISSLSLKPDDKRYVGLFRYSDQGTVVDLVLINPRVDANGQNSVGSLAGYYRYGSIEQCGVIGGVVQGDYQVGGLCGFLSKGKIVQCYSYCDVSGDSSVGGLTGYNYGTLEDCYTQGVVSGTSYVGGLSGRNGTDSFIKYCYSNASVSGSEYVGGLNGYNSAYSYYISRCYWDDQSSGQSSSAGGEGKTTAEMMTAETYIGWSAQGQWRIQEGTGYPTLTWQGQPGGDLWGKWYADGHGTEMNPYIIRTPKQLDAIGQLKEDWDKHFKMETDIDLSEYGIDDFHNIAYGNSFTGVFDGNNHTISNLTSQWGLFYRLNDTNASICNLGLIDPNIQRSDGGGIVGSLVAGEVIDCFVQGGHCSGGGLVAWNSGRIERCFTDCAVNGFGGLVAYNESTGEIHHSYSLSNVMCTSYNGTAGGLVGRNRGLIQHSYSRGNATSTGGLGDGGGLVGTNEGGAIICCYSTGSATGNTVGGLVVFNGGKSVNVISSFWDKQSSGLLESASGLGRTTNEMKTAANYIGWGDGKTWTITEGSDYPHLWWENAEGVLMIDDFVYGGGSGQTEDPYQITNVNHLVALGHSYSDWDKHFILTNDLNLLGIPLDTSIGAEPIPFTGFFDGNGHTISNYTGGNDSWGLFGFIDGNEVEICDVGLVNPAVDLEIYDVGSLVRMLQRGRIVNCYAHNVNIRGKGRIGGLVGKVGVESQVINCYTTGFVGYNSTGTYGYGNMGGMIGSNEGDVTNCWSSAQVLGSYYQNVGGLIGLNSSTGMVWKGYATGDVHSRKDNIGGFVGGNNGQVIECWASGEVEGDFYNENVGGLVGENRGVVNGCYSSNTRVLQSTNAGGLVGVNDGEIQNCHSTTPVYGHENVGGLAGKNNGQIVDCNAMGNIYGIWEFESGSNYGGLVGHNFEMGIINSCKASGRIYGYDYFTDRWWGNNVGGLVGWNEAAEIVNSYATGRIDGGDIVGGLVGKNEQGLVVYCYSTGLVKGNSNTGGLIGSSTGRAISAYWNFSTSGQGFSAGGNGKTTLQLKSLDTFIGWGCYDVWVLNAGVDYPRLVWEGLPGNYLINDSLYGGGNGTADDPYLISTPEHMAHIGLATCDWDKHFKVVADIDMSSVSDFSPVGVILRIPHIDPYYGFPFSGTLDGGHHTISSLNIFRESEIGTGLFGHVHDPNAQIKNLRIVDASIGGDKYVGALVGYLWEGAITDCNVESTTVLNGSYIGGLVGYNVLGSISYCSSSGIVSGIQRAGGLVGLNKYGTIYRCFSSGQVKVDLMRGGGLVGEQCDYQSSPSYLTGRIVECYSTADVNASDYDAGGLLGYNGGKIANCYAFGNVTTERYAGGLIGRSDTSYRGVLNCYSAGVVSGNENVGGLVGYAGYYGASDIVYCYWDVDTSGQVSSCAGVGKTTTEMISMETFTYWGFEEGIWTINDEQDYPRLAWQGLPGQAITLPKYGGGIGDVNKPYLICTARQLNTIGLFEPHWDKQFRLMNDIDLANLGERTFNPIGGTSRYDAFEGTFEGEGYAIYNLSFNSQNQDYVGLFRWIGSGAKIRNLTIVDPNVQAGLGTCVGALVGKVYNSYHGSIENCHVYGGWVTGWNMVGGLVGRIDYPILFTNCSANTTVVSGNMGVGGLVGWLYTGSLNNSFSNATVIGVERVGGLIGGDTGGNVHNCYAKGTVSGIRGAGGLIGYNHSGNEIMNCFAATIVEANEIAGGLVGENFQGYRAKFSGCFWDVNLAPDVNGIGNLYDPNVTPATTVQMKKRNTYINAGWDFIEEKVKGSNDVWEICDGTNYPKLYWQIPIQGDYICPDGVDFFDFSLLAGFWQKQAIEQDYNYDGLVDFYDWAYFADFWNGDYYELSLFLDQWLTQTAAFVDIAPQSGDNIIDWQDLVKLNENWLEGVE